MSGDLSGSSRAVDWAPSKAQWAWINLVGVALIVLGFVGHFGAWALPRSASGWPCSPWGIDRPSGWRASTGASWA